MSQDCVCRENEISGFRAITLENELIAVTVLPDKGADIYSLVSKPHNLDVLWKSPWGLTHGPVPGAAAFSEAAWLDQYEGGWQVLFPNGGDACVYRGAPLSFHGEASAARWTCSHRSSATEAAMDLTLTLRRSPFTISRTLSLRRGEPVLHIEESIANLGQTPLHYMWGHHPAFGRPFLDGARLQVPARRFLAHDTEISPACRIGAGASEPWPVAVGKNGTPVDLSIVPSATERVTEFGYLCDLEAGWYALVNSARNLAFGLAWPLEIFPFLWFWQELGGSLDYPWYGRCSVMAVEPVTSIPGAGLGRAVASGTAPVLRPGETLRAKFAAMFFEPGDVESIDTSGRVRMKMSL